MILYDDAMQLQMYTDVELFALLLVIAVVSILRLPYNSIGFVCRICNKSVLELHVIVGLVHYMSSSVTSSSSPVYRGMSNHKYNMATRQPKPHVTCLLYRVMEEGDGMPEVELLSGAACGVCYLVYIW